MGKLRNGRQLVLFLLLMTAILFPNLARIHASTLTVGCGADYSTISAAVGAASTGDTIQVCAGTYNEAVSVNKSLKLISRDGEANTIISLPTTSGSIVVYVTANAVTVSGFTLQGGLMGIQLTGSTSSTITNNLAVDNGMPSPHGHGFAFEGGGQNIIANNIAENSYAEGFYFHQTNGNYVYNDTVTKKTPGDAHSTQTGDAFGFVSSNSNYVIGNLADSPAFDGFLFHTACSSNVVVGNTVQSDGTDGMTFSDSSNSNYIARNLITSSTHSGIWLNNESDFNWVTGNTVQNDIIEVGIADYGSSWNTIEYNTVINNQQAGIFLWDDPSHLYGHGQPPRYNTIQWNTVSGNYPDGIALRGASTNRVLGNFIHGAGGTDAAIVIDSSGGSASSNNNEVFENTLVAFNHANFFMGASGSGNTLYHNNAFGNALNWDYQPATWDRGPAIGGNYWQHYTGFQGGSSQDHYQFASENGWQLPSVSIVSPSGGENWPAGASKVIRWTALGAINMTLSYSIDGGSTWTTIASNAPNIGYYSWTLPTAPAGSVILKIDGKNSAGTTTATATSNSFSIVQNAVSLNYPVGNDRLTASSTTTLWWSSSLPVVKVDLLYNCGSSWQTIVSGLTNTGSYSWTLPGTAAASCFVKVQGRDSGNSIIGADQNDIPFRIIPGAASMSVSSPAGGAALQIGASFLIQWLSSGSTSVDVYYDPGTGPVLQSTIQDTGRFYWTVPDSTSNTVTIRIDGKTAGGSLAATGYSGVFTIGFDYRLYNSGSTSNLGGITIVHGNSGSITITGNMAFGIAQSVTLSCSMANGSPLPAGVSCNPTSGTPPFSITLTVNTSASTPQGYYPIKVTGTAGSWTRITIFILQVT